MNMIEKIKIGLNTAGIDTWIIRQESASSRELFFIRKDLDMNRAKDVEKFHITVYRDFTEGDEKYRGAAVVVLSPGADKQEIEECLTKAYYAASFVKNPWYPLADPEKNGRLPAASRFADDDQNSVLDELRESLYRNDTHEEGGVNSAEIFVTRYDCRLITSAGLDVTYPRYQGDIELICDWKTGSEEVEIYNMFSFSDVNAELIEEESREQIENCRLRARAEKAPDLKNIPVILTGDAVKETMEFYVTHASAQMVFEKVGRGKIGEILQREEGKGEVTGDLITMSLEPFLDGSPHSVPYDNEGTLLKQIELYRNGKLLNYHGGQQFSHYMDVPATGRIHNYKVAGGTGSIEDWRKRPHVEIRSFSDFQMDPITGDFGGEVRLALWFDGEKTVPLTGASLSACLFDKQKEMYLSRETVNKENYTGPAYLMIPKGHLAG